MMEITIEQFADAGAFLAEAEAFLLAHEAVNNVPLGNARRLVANPPSTVPRVPAPFFAVARHPDGHILTAAVQTPGWAITLAKHPLESDLTMLPLARHAWAAGYRFPGVNGPQHSALAFANAWCALSGQQPHIHMRMCVYQLDALIPLPSDQTSLGTLRQATEADFELVARWAYLMGQDIREPVTEESARTRTKDRLARGEAVLWEVPGHEGPVSMAGKTRPTGTGITVNYVYTPPEHRGKGYASGCVAAFSAALLKEYRFCALFTDLDNPISNSIYQKMGYRPLENFFNLAFKP
jgi:uncharacterized protein